VTRLGESACGPAEGNEQYKACLSARQGCHQNKNLRLRSCRIDTSYHIAVTDSEIGHVAGFAADPDRWGMRYLIVGTSKWWMGHHLVIAPGGITGVQWSNLTVSTALSQESVKRSPVHDLYVTWTREIARSRHRHHGGTIYWYGIRARKRLFVSLRLDAPDNRAPIIKGLL
jgi:hypothetical protein